MELRNGIKTFYAKNGSAWRAWLKKNHSKETNVWLIMYRKGSKTPSVYWSEAVDEALCFGWIDSKANKRDAESFYLSFSRRKPKSKWSAINKKKIARLVKEKKMTPAGMLMVDLAKKSGTWRALEPVDALKIPTDLKSALAKNGSAKKNFEAFPLSSKKIILEWVLNAKQEETRSRRINEAVTLAAKNIRANHYHRK